jgi:Holliday junction resolvase RusA-like endonuclease
MIIYEVLGDPTPWAAPRRNGNTYYNPKSKEKAYAIWQLKAKFNHEQLSCPIRADFTFYFPVPKSASKIKRMQMLNGLIHHIGKPDRSNCLKFMEDCLQEAGIISNDSIICEGESKKLYGLEPKVIIIIQPISLLSQQKDRKSCE